MIADFTFKAEFASEFESTIHEQQLMSALVNEISPEDRKECELVRRLHESLWSLRYVVPVTGALSNWLASAEQPWDARAPDRLWDPRARDRLPVLITARDVVMGHPAPFDRSRSVPITAERFALALAVDMVLSGGTDADLIHVEAARAYASTLGRLRRRWRKRHRLYATAWVTPDDQFEAYRRLGDFRASTPHRACVRVGRQTYGH